MDVVHPRCCGIDVHQASLAVCVAIKDKGESEKHKLRCGTTTAELLRLADWLHLRPSRSPCHFHPSLSAIGG